MLSRKQTCILICIVFFVLLCSSCSKAPIINTDELNGTWYAQSSGTNVPELSFDSQNGQYAVRNLMIADGSFEIIKKGTAVELSPFGAQNKIIIPAKAENGELSLNIATAMGNIIFLKKSQNAQNQTQMPYEDAVKDNDEIQTTISFNSHSSSEKPDSEVELFISAIPDEKNVISSAKIRVIVSPDVSSPTDFLVCHTVSEKYNVTVYSDVDKKVLATEKEISNSSIFATFTVHQDLLDLVSPNSDISKIDVYKYEERLSSYYKIEAVAKDEETMNITVPITGNGKYVLAVIDEDDDKNTQSDFLLQQDYAYFINACLLSVNWESDEHTIEFKSDNLSNSIILDSGEPMNYSISKAEYEQGMYKFKFSIDGAGDGVDAILTNESTQSFNEYNSKITLTITWLNGQTMTFTSNSFFTNF